MVLSWINPGGIDLAHRKNPKLSGHFDTPLSFFRPCIFGPTSLDISIYANPGPVIMLSNFIGDTMKQHVPNKFLYSTLDMA
jgi:hypothetical protein